MVFLSWVKEMDKTIDAIHPWMTTLPPYLHIFAHCQWYLPLNCWLQTCLHYSSSSELMAVALLLELVTSSMTYSALQSDSQPAIQVLKNTAWKKNK